MTSIDPRIFRAYDIRGKAYSQLSVEACYEIGRAFGDVLSERYGSKQPSPRVVLGRDARTHGPEFEEQVSLGLLRIKYPGLSATRAEGENPLTDCAASSRSSTLGPDSTDYLAGAAAGASSRSSSASTFEALPRSPRR